MPLSCNLGTLTSWNPLGRSRPVTGLLYLLPLPILDKFDIIIVPQFYKFLRILVFKVNSFEMFSLLQERFSADVEEKAKSTLSYNNENFPRHL